jgi:MarR family transcriptional regulator, 2-MHQ and catechol-resistance regulon repressor
LSWPWRPELAASTPGRKGGARRRGATFARPPEVDAYEIEYPGASWLANRVLRELEDVGSLAQALVAAVARRHRLSHAALNALAVTEGNGGPLAAGELSARMHITSGTMTSVLDTLEGKGYLRRHADPTDRRRVLVDLTPAGQAVLDRLLPEVQQAVTAVMSALDDQALHALLHHLAVVREALAAAPPDLPPPPARRPPPHLRRS